MSELKRIIFGFKPSKRCIACLVLTGLFFCASFADAETDDLYNMNIEDLMKMEVYSVSKKSESLSGTAAAIYVITQEDIRRSGYTSIAEVLRIVPGLEVARINSSEWAITSRGFNGLFAQKLLVMIDGRTVYSPFHSGVNWIYQDTFLDDIDRIEVIRGPGGTMWGANAVNGVINIITKNSNATSGLLANAGGGNEETAMGGVRYGGRIGNGTTYRMFLKYNDRDGMVDSAREDLGDEWDSRRGGFRIDSRVSNSDSMTVQGEIFDSNARYEKQGMFSRNTESSEGDGGHILARWNHSKANGALMELQMYLDSFNIEEPFYKQNTETLDLEFARHESLIANIHEISWGGGYRSTSFESEITPTTQIEPGSKRDNKYSFFIQDKIGIIKERLYWTIGSKYEHNDYTGSEYEPSTRLIWHPNEIHTLWAAVSQAVRTPGRADYDMTVNLPMGMGAVVPNRDLDSEKLMAYELGYRAMPADGLSIDMTAFYNDYWDLHTTEESGIPFFNYEATQANKMEATSRGLEIAANWNATNNWRLKAGYTYIDIEANLDASSSDTESESLFEKGVPNNQVQIMSYLDLPLNLEFDAAVYYIGKLEHQDISSYIKTDLRLGWQPSKQLDMSLALNNLFDKRHDEYSIGRQTSIDEDVERSVYLKLTWKE